MGWKSVRFVRSDLYEAVWSTPVTKVAKTYGMSDVALRKICRRLGVPLPNAGHWAKVAHGKPTYRPPLPKGDYPHEHRTTRWTEPADEELLRRLDAASAPTQPPVAVTPRTSVDDFHRLVRRTADRLAKGRVDERGWPTSLGGGALEVSVAPQTQYRALVLLDLVLQAFSAAGFEVVQEEGTYVAISGYSLGWRVREYAQSKKAKPPDNWTRECIPDALFGTGKLRLDFLDHPRGRVLLTLRDTLAHSLEEQMATLPQRLLELVGRRRVCDTLREERESAELEQRRERVQRAVRRDEELERLKRTELEAQQWHRAQVLRGYAATLRAAAAGAASDQAQAHVATAQWTERAADWLDPVVKRHWPEVDDAPTGFWL